MRMTFDKYDQLCEALQEIENIDHTWLPSEEDMEKHVYPNPDPYLIFLIWLTETSEVTDEESKAAMKRINRVLTQYVELIDEEDFNDNENKVEGTETNKEKEDKSGVH